MADKPYCYLRTCLETTVGAALILERQQRVNPADFEKFNELYPDFVAALKNRGKLNTKGRFVSHLPIELDQSNSAFAHIGLLMGDEELQKKAGMDQEWSDVYSDIAESVNLGGPDKNETRKIIKKVSVPWSYGAGIQTCGDAIVKIVDENPNKYQYLQGLDIEEINDLALEVIRVLEGRFKVCVPVIK